MSRNNPRYRHKLSDSQLRVLKLLYKFRYVTVLRLVVILGLKDHSNLHQRLRVLLDQGYIAKQYDSSFKLQGKAARYYLAPKGFKALRSLDLDAIHDSVLRAMYKNASLGETYIDRHLKAADCYLAIKYSYPDVFHILSANEIRPYEHMPHPTPDLYLVRRKSSSNKINAYFLEVLTDNRLFAIKKRIEAYIKHFDSGEWDAEEEATYPAVLFVCLDEAMAAKVRRHAERQMDDSYFDEDDFEIYVITLGALLGTSKGNAAVWYSLFADEHAPKKPVAL